MIPKFYSFLLFLTGGCIGCVNDIMWWTTYNIAHNEYVTIAIYIPVMRSTIFLRVLYSSIEEGLRAKELAGALLAPYGSILEIKKKLKFATHKSTLTKEFFLFQSPKQRLKVLQHAPCIATQYRNLQGYFASSISYCSRL